MNRVISLILFTTLLASHTNAQWSTDPSNNLIVGYGAIPELCSDGAGGCYITYQNNIGYPTHLVLHRLNQYGYQPWGVRLQLTGVLPQQAFASIVADGFHGVIVAYLDEDISGTPHDPVLTYRVRLQRIDSSGNFLWGANGVRVSVSETNQSNHVIVPDGTGGCIVAWHDTLYDQIQQNIRIQRITSEGQRAWSDTGHFVGYSQFPPVICNSDRSGVLIEYFFDGSYHAKRINSLGEFLWGGDINIPTGGNPIRVDDDGFFYLLGGEFLGYRNNEALFTYNVQKVDSLGAFPWGNVGVVLDTLNANNFPSDDLAVAHGLSYVAWPQLVGGTFEIMTQFVRSDGSSLFPFGGRAVSKVSSEKRIVGIIGSSPDGPLYVWWDNRNAGGTYAQRIDTSGQNLWDSSDVAISIPAIDYTKVTTDGNGGAIVAGFYQSDFSIRAQQVSKNGSLDEIITEINKDDRAHPAEFFLNECHPNPFNSSTIVSYDLPAASYISLEVFDILGRKIATLYQGMQHAGKHSVVFEGEKLSSGIYIVRLNGERSFPQTRRVVLMR